LKFLIIINGWSGKNIGGGDYHMLQVMKEWSKLHDISLVIPLFGFLFCRSLLLEKYRVYFTSSDIKARESFQLILAYFKRIMRSIFLHFDEKPDVIMCSSHMLFDILPGLILQFRFRTKLVVYVHLIVGKFAHTDHRRGILSRISILEEKLSLPLIRSANIIFVVSEEVRSQLIEMGFDPAKIRVSSNGLDYSYIATIRPINEILYDACFCGRLVKGKGIYDLIEVWKLVSLRCPDAKLVVIGDGAEYSALLNKIKEAGLEANIQLIGFVSERDKFLTMQRSKLFIFPSYEESWGIAVAEAIACGLDAVTYDLGAYKIYEGHLKKVETGNTRKMAQVVVEIINKKNSGKYIDGRNLAKNEPFLDWKHVANKELACIKEITLE
jgi:glycosyltransferase involved in cell wall biosynthesis